MISPSELARVAEATGFHPEFLERAAHLYEILEGLRSHPFLSTRIALKGGTALNAFVLPLPRLSVDIDLNYIGSKDRETMLAERPKMEQAAEAVCSRLGLQIRRIPSEHAGGKVQIGYRSISGLSRSLALDLNFLLRTPLWPCTVMSSHPIGSQRAERIPILDLHELTAGKLAALFSRNASRDLFDVCNLLQHADMEPARLRLGFVIYGGASRRDWRTISLKDVSVGSNDVANQLVPMLQRGLAPARKEIGNWTKRLVHDCRALVSELLPFRTDEREFLTRLNDHGEIAADLLTDDPRMRAIITTHPALQWKAQNVREYFKK